MQVKGLYSVYGFFRATIRCLWLSENDFWDLILSFEHNRTSNVFVDVNDGVKNHSFKFALISDEYIIMIVMQKLKLMQEFTSAINVECQHSS